MTLTTTREPKYVSDLREDLAELQERRETAPPDERSQLDRYIVRIGRELREVQHGTS